MRDWAGLAHVDRPAMDLEARWDDVAERDQLADVAPACDVQDAIVVPVGDEEPAPVLLHRVLNPAGDEEVRLWRVIHRPGADVGDRGRTAVPLDAIEAVDDAGLADGRTDDGHEHVRPVTGEGDVHRPADADLGDRRRQAGREGRDRAGPRIHSQDASSGAVRHVQRLVGADRAAGATTAHAGGRGEAGQLVRLRQLRRHVSARCGGYARRHHGGDGDQRRQPSCGVHIVLLSLATHGARAAALGGVLPPLGRESSVRSSARAGVKSSPPASRFRAR